MTRPWFETNGWYAPNRWFGQGDNRAANASAESPDEPPERSDPGVEREREVAPPIEREHETYAGVFEEDERRERQRGGWSW